MRAANVQESSPPECRVYRALVSAIAIFRQRPSRMHTHPSRAVRESSLRYVLITQLLLLSSVAFGGDKPASCELARESIVSRSSSGLAQVSNLGDIEIICRVPARPFPPKPGENRNGLRAATAAYEISPNLSKKSVPSEAHESGGGFGPDPEGEWVDFYVHIPLGSAERDAEIRRYLAKIEKSMAPEQITEEAHQRALEWTRELFYQHRVGHFQVECRISDGDRVIGVGVVELEVLFKGRFSEVGLPASPPV
jgi:hypothetical protein